MNKQSLFRLLLFSCSILCTTISHALQVLQTTPANLSITNVANTTIAIQFDKAVDPLTVSYGNFKVFGRWSGPMEVAFSVSSDQKTVELIPFENYFAGEWVTVSISKNVKSGSGEALQDPYAWNFWIAAGPGSLNQALLKTIELRQSGEGLIQTYGAYAGDLNNDGYSDLTVVNETSDDLRILLNDGSGDYQDFTIHQMGNATPSPNEGGDFNGDGQIDLAVCTAHDNELRVLFGAGNGTFDSMDVYATGDAARGLVVLDIEGDGDDDIIVANRESSNISVFTNDGTGKFTTTTFDPEGFGESGLAVADANNDGIMDLFVGYFNSQEVAILLGDGQGGYVQSTKAKVDGFPWMVAAADVNGDGKADLISVNSTGNTTAVLLGDGFGGASSISNYYVNGASFPLAIDLGDLDGDGDLDMVTSNFETANYIVLENDGTGIFSMAAILPASKNASCAIIHDRDNDGDLDITGTDEGDDVVILFENTGPSTVVDPAAQFQLNVFPNPSYKKVNISYELKSSAQVELALYDLHGRLVNQIIAKQQAGGAHNVQWVPNGITLVNSNYILILKVDEYATAHKITFLK